jgi:hypothetical protein
MKNFYFSAILLFCSVSLFAQVGVGTTTPNSTLDVRGSFSSAYRAFTTSTSAAITDNVLVYTGTSAATLTLPTAVGIPGREYWVKNASSFVLTIATTSSQTIDGLSSWTLTQTNKAIRLVSDGANWYATSESLPGSTGTPWALGGNNVTGLQNIGTTSNFDFPFITNSVEKMRLSATGNLGLGLNAIPKAAIGAAKFAIEGTNASLNGPHMQFTTSADNYPLMQVLPWNHNDIWTFYDSYYDGGFKSSTTTGGNFAQSKNGGNFITYYAAVNTQGGAIASFSPGIVLNNTGKVGIGTTVFDGTYPEKLVVDAGVTTSVNAIAGKGSINNYLQLNIKNSSNGNIASSDVVATADNGNETSNYIDMGINGSGNTSGVFGLADDAYLYNVGNNLLIGTSTAGKSLVFMTGGSSQATNERMRISGTGSVGIGTNAPNSTLEVVGSVANSIITTTANITLDATNYTAVITGGTPTVTLPAAAAGNARRIYVLVNETGSAVTISGGVYKNFSGVNTGTVAANSSITIQSDGTNWYRIQ